MDSKQYKRIRHHQKARENAEWLRASDQLDSWEPYKGNFYRPTILEWWHTLTSSKSNDRAYAVRCIREEMRYRWSWTQAHSYTSKPLPLP